MQRFDYALIFSTEEDYPKPLQIKKIANYYESIAKNRRSKLNITRLSYNETCGKMSYYTLCPTSLVDKIPRETKTSAET